MKKIMFNDRYGLTNAVLAGKKTVTRRVMKVTKLRSLTNCLKGVKYECMVDEAGNNYEAPYYVGEIVAVAQNYKDAGISREYIDNDPFGGMAAGWSNKMFVRAELMPYQIRITAVRAERLQQITDEDYIREGVRFIPVISNYYFEDFDKEEGFYFGNPRSAFVSLIDKISGRGTWERNPFVWRIEFKRVK